MWGMDDAMRIREKEYNSCFILGTTITVEVLGHDLGTT